MKADIRDGFQEAALGDKSVFANITKVSPGTIRKQPRINDVIEIVTFHPSLLFEDCVKGAYTKLWEWGLVIAEGPENKIMQFSAIKFT